MDKMDSKFSYDNKDNFDNKDNYEKHGQLQHIYNYNNENN